MASAHLTEVPDIGYARLPAIGLNESAGALFPQDVQARSVLVENLDGAARWLAGRLTVPPELCPEDLAIGEGRLVTLEDKTAAVYRDEYGAYYALSPTCTHLGCTVNWNAHDKTWDCPCHGGRYSMTGEVISGPPTRPLAIYEPPAR